jgi:1-acyl-sn-glycerol-3-phosphate acyltransferase
MRWLRIIVRGTAAAIVVSLTFVAAAFGAALVRLWGRIARRPRAEGQWRSLVFQLSTRCLSRILGMRVTVKGNPPNGPFVLVSNHLSYVDVILLGSQVRCVFISKAEVQDWPLIGTVVRSVGTVFVDREAKRNLPQVVKRMEEVLESGRGVVFFPEGTTGRGDQVAPFRPSLLAPAARSQRPVHYASLSYRTRGKCPPAKRAICWWGDMKFMSHITQLLALPGFDASLTFGSEPIREDDRKVLAARLHRAIAQQFEAVG